MNAFFIVNTSRKFLVGFGELKQADCYRTYILRECTDNITATWKVEASLLHKPDEPDNGWNSETGKNYHEQGCCEEGNH